MLLDSGPVICYQYTMPAQFQRLLLRCEQRLPGSCLALILTGAVLCFAPAVRAQTFHYVLEPGSTITPSYYASPVGPTEPLTGTFSWTLVSYDSYWSTYNFNTSELHFQSASYSLTLIPGPYNSGTSATSPAAGFTATVTASGGPLTSPLSFVPWPANDGTYEGDPAMPSRLIFLHERLDPAVGALISFTAVLVPEPSTSAFIALGLVLMAGWKSKRY
jgi:hypothetical protein